jgi:hypothetical protein
MGGMGRLRALRHYNAAPADINYLFKSIAYLNTKAYKPVNTLKGGGFSRPSCPIFLECFPTRGSDPQEKRAL